jgi:hypothetical protein
VWRVIFNTIFRHPPPAKSHQTHTHTHTHLYTIFIIIIFIIRHQSALDKPVSALPNTLFKGLQSCLHPIDLQFSTIFAILLLLILVTCRSKLDLYLLSFSSTGSAFRSSKIYSFLLWSNMCIPAVLLKNFISIDFNVFYPPNFDPV